MPRGRARHGAGRPRGSVGESCRTALRNHIMNTPSAQTTHLLTSESGLFAGDAVAFLQAIYQDESLPLGLRQSAAMSAAAYERPRMSDQRILVLEQRATAISDAELKAAHDAFDAERLCKLNELQSMWDEFTADRSEEIAELLATGDITPKAAEAIRKWHLPPDRLALPPPSEPVLNNFEEPAPPPAAATAPEAPPPSNRPNRNPRSSSLPRSPQATISRHGSAAPCHRPRRRSFSTRSRIGNFGAKLVSTKPTRTARLPSATPRRSRLC